MFFYDSELQLYINSTPLLISSTVQRAAAKLGLSLRWDHNGHVNQVSYDEAELLCKELGIVVLDVKQFMHLAQRETSVASPDFAEWLHDTFSLSADHQMLDAKDKPLSIPASRPAWFNLCDVGDDGLPAEISPKPAAGKWKFWTLDDPSFVSGAVRSFVTSSGTCSLDLGIPRFAKHANLMIRECYRKEPSLFASPLENIWRRYENLTLARNDDEIKDFFDSLELDETMIKDRGLDEFMSHKNSERFVDLAGKKRLMNGHFDGLQAVNIVDSTPATCPDTVTTYVAGHLNPDADSIVTSVFEAARRTLLYGSSCAAWTDEVPYAVAQILGSKICANLLTVPKFGPTHDIVLVDCHSFEEGREYQVKSVIDHHIISRSFPYYVATSQEVSWSSTIQVYIKFLGSGMDLDQPSARMLLEATLLEAEPHLMAKMSLLDKLAFERLSVLAKWNTSYPDLMTMLTSAANTPDPFMNDYKETLFGFAVIKATERGCFGARAEANNRDNHLPLTIVKQVVYNSQFDTVLCETISLYFNEDYHDKGFRAAIIDVVTKACQAFHGSDHVSVSGTEVEVTNVSHQTPRLLLGPLLEDIVSEHLKFFYSKAIGMYVSCGFLNQTEGPRVTQETQSTAPTTGISFEDATSFLSQSTNTAFPSLYQYWQVYRECIDLKHKVMLRSLRDRRYVELLNTVIRNHKEVTHGPDGVPFPVDIIEAKPALIRPDSIDEKTGFPTALASPDNYGDPSLWRYWSTDREENVATRGHIFIMDQTCIDLKIGRHEATRYLTFRPLYHDIMNLKYEIVSDGGSWVTVNIFPRPLAIS